MYSKVSTNPLTTFLTILARGLLISFFLPLSFFTVHLRVCVRVCVFHQSDGRSFSLTRGKKAPIRSWPTLFLIDMELS